MANWWELSEHAIAADEDTAGERAAAYFNTFYGTEDGKRVLLDICQMCYSYNTSAEGTLALVKLYQMIRSRAGVNPNVEKAAIDAEAEALQ